MNEFREICSENYISYILDGDSQMYSAAYHVIKKGQYTNFVKGYFMKQDGKNKIVFDTCKLRSLIQMLDVIDSKSLMRILGKAIFFLYWIKHSSFIRLDSIILDTDKIYLDSTLNDVKFICLPIRMGLSETDCIIAEKQLVYAISCILYYANHFEDRCCQLMYADCQSGYYLLDELYRDLCNNRYGDLNLMPFDDKENDITNRQKYILKNTDGIHPDIIINKNVFVIGKKREIVDYCMKDDGISRQHCKFKINGNDLLIEDMNSTNGTLVNEVRIFPGQQMPLQSGDWITIAGIKYVVQK